MGARGNETSKARTKEAEELYSDANSILARLERIAYELDRQDDWDTVREDEMAKAKTVAEQAQSLLSGDLLSESVLAEARALVDEAKVHADAATPPRSPRQGRLRA